MAIAEYEREKLEAVDSTSVIWNQEGLRQVVAWANTPNFFERDYRATLTEALAEGNDFVILSHADGTVDVAEFLRLLDGVLIMDRSGSHDLEVVQDFILEAVRTDVIAGRARALGLEEVLMSADSPSTVLRNRFVTLYNQRAIEEQVPEASDKALRAFYEAHRDSLFYQLAAATLYVITRSDEEEAEALWDRVERDERFEDLTGRWLVRPFIKNRDGAIASASGTEPPALGAVAFDLEEGEVRGPIAYEHPEGGTHYAIVKLNSRRDERPLRYEEVEHTIAEAFTRHHRARIRADVEEDLRARYPVTIYRNLLERYIAEQ